MVSPSSKRVCRHTDFDSSTELLQVGQGSQDHESRIPMHNSTTELLQVGQGSQDHESRSPMEKISPEILAAIIEFASSTDLDRPFPVWPQFFDSTFEKWRAPWTRRRPHSAEDLNHYMLVSRRWRDVIREFPRLWNTIMVDQPSRRMKDPLADCLNRSGRTGLKAFVAMSSSSMEDDIAAIAAHSSRLKMLYLASDGSACLRGGLSQFSLPAPVLQRLVIDLEDVTPIQVPILFEGHMPGLVDLSLRGPICLSGNAFLGLRHLAIHTLPPPWPAGMSASESLSDFIALLRGSHELEDLRVWNTSSYFGIFENLFVAPPDQIIFTKLRRLSFGFCEPWHVKAFLRLFQLPAQTCLYILGTTPQLVPRCSLFDTLPDDISALANLHNITKLELLLDTTRSHAIGIGPASAFYIKMDPPDPMMQHPHLYHPSNICIDLAHARKLDGIQDIKELWLRRSGMGRLSSNAEAAFATTFASARSLSKLVLLLPRTYLEKVLYALGAGFDIDNPGELVCPALTHLTICSPDFISVMSLTKCAAFRAGKGVPLGELVLHCRCEEYVSRYIRSRQELEQFVTEVKVMCDPRVPAPHFPVPPEYVNQDIHTYWEDWRLRS